MPTPSPLTTFKPWSEEQTRAGIRPFDAEHRGMALLIEQLHTAALVQRDRARAELIFTRILQQARVHFVHEEDVLHEHGYPGLDRHVEEHSRLLKEAQEHQRAYSAGTLSALLLTRFLQSWLVDHIRDTDREYTAFLKGKGLS